MSRQTRAVAGVVFIAAGAAIATGWWWPSTAEAEAEVGDAVDVVEIDSDSGDVSIRAADVRTTTVRQRFSYTWGKPDDAFKVDGTTLVLDDCGWNCDVDYDIVVPLGTTVRGEADSGEVTITGVAEADVHADSGSITLRDITGRVRAEADSGNIDGFGLSGPVEADADSGDITLRLTSAADVTAEADSGDIELTVPDAAYRVTGDTDSGERDIGVRTDPDAPHVLTLDTDSGDVTVTSR